jgi:phosphoribosylglycinamide formyltransferase-1
MSKVAIFASGAGSNADRILQYLAKKQSLIQIDCLVTNKREAGIYKVAEKFNVPIFCFPNTAFAKGDSALEFLMARNNQWIVLAGFLRKIELNLIEEFENRIFNLHPSLLPKYGGKGMYGSKVHEAVLAAGENESGISIHLVNSEFDKGEVLFQAKCKVKKGQTVEELSKNIQKLEHDNFADTVVKYIEKSDAQM